MLRPDPHATAAPSGVAVADALVGRTQLLAETRGWIEDARRGIGRFVLLTGEAGIGKTRTAHEILAGARAADVAVAVGRCHPDPGTPPYWPWVQILRTLLRRGEADAIRRSLGADLARVAEILPEVRRPEDSHEPPPALEAAAARFRVLDALGRVVVDRAHHRPLALLLDDLQWADHGSASVLELLAPAIGDVPLVIVATLRTAGADAASPGSDREQRLARLATVVPLAGIALADVGELLALAAGAPGPADAVAALHRRTRGNPLFVRELLRLLAATHELTRLDAATVDAVPLPTGIRHVIAQRLDGLAPAERAVLEAAAVVGREFDLEIVRAAATTPAGAPDATTVLAAVERAISGGWLTRRGDVAGTYAFTHDLVREALADATDPARRAALHGRIGTARAANAGDVEDVATHFIAVAAAGHAAEAADWATRAGVRAAGQYAYEAAVRHFEHALAALAMTRPGDRREQRCELLLALGDALARGGDTVRAGVVLHEAAEAARALGSADHLARAALLLPQGRGEFTTSAELFDPATAALLDEARVALGDRESALRARVLAALSASPGRATLADDAVALARRLHDPATLGYALHRSLLTLGPLRAPERLARAEEILVHAARARDKLLEFEGQTERLMALIEHGDRAAIDEAVARHGRLVHELRQPGPRWTNAVVRALQAFLDGALDESERRAIDAFAIGREAQPATAEQAFAGQLALIRGEQDRFTEVVPAVEAMAAAQPDVPAWRCALAYMYAETGRAEESRATLDRLALRGFAELPLDGLLHVALANLAEACVALAAREHAAVLYDRLLPLAGRQLVVGGALCLGAADRHLAMLAALADRPAEAEARFEAALAAHERLGAVPWLAHTRVEYARFLTATGHAPARARALLDEAERAAATYGLPRVARRADAVPPSPPPQKPDRRDRLRARLAREGEYWTVAWSDRTGRVRDLKGLRYLAYLLASPGRDVHVYDLLALTEGAPAVEATSDVEALDTRARASYRARLAELRVAIDAAEHASDTSATASLHAEVDRLEHALAAAYGLGSLRPAADASRERARKSVTNRLRSAVRRLATVVPELERHLAVALRTGTLCAYRPDRDVVWDVVP